MIQNTKSYREREEGIRKLALRGLSVKTSVKRLVELIQAGWKLVGHQPRPMPLNFARLISSKS